MTSYEIKHISINIALAKIIIMDFKHKYVSL